MTTNFPGKIESMNDIKTPASSGTHLVRCKEQEEIQSDQEQKEFRLGVRSLLYLLKHSRPELLNCVQELSEAMDQANQARWKALHRVIKFVRQTKKCRMVLLLLKKHFIWELKAYSDSDFAADTETRKIISVFIIFLCGAADSWRSKVQKIVSLSLTEAEYMVISESWL